MKSSIEQYESGVIQGNSPTISNALMPWLCGAVVFAVAIYHLSPTVAPYRDAGEMVAGTLSLNILHPPAYPLYTLTGRVALEIIPFGNFAYRLNILSGLFQAFAAGLASWILMRLKIQPLLALLCAILWSLTKSVFHLSLVSEMYSLGGLCAVALIGCLTPPPPKSGGCDFRPEGVGLTTPSKTILLASFLLGLALTNRTEIILAFPAICVLAIGERISQRRIALSALLFLIGFSVYLYLPIRSMQNPSVNWANPDTLSRLVAAISRKTYGYTLHPLSSSYQSAEVFLPQLTTYIKKMCHEWHWVAIGFMFLGFFWKGVSLHLRLGLLVFLALTGPFFIFLAKLPVVPQFMAVLEAHYLLPTVPLVFLLAFGVQSLQDMLSLKVKWLLPILISVLTMRTLWLTRDQINLRQNFWAFDHAQSIFRYVPSDGVVVAYKDLPLFSLWALHAMGIRRDVTVVSQGLSAYPWYQKSLASLPLTFLTYGGGWNNFLHGLGGRPWLLTLESAGLLDINLPLYPAGVGVSGKMPSPLESWDEFLISHDSIRSAAVLEQDFFTKYIREQFVSACLRYAVYYIETNRFIKAETLLQWVQAIQPKFPLLYYIRAFLARTMGNRAAARRFYEISISQYEELLTNIARSMYFTEVEEVRRDLAEALTEIGALFEEEGHSNEAMSYYKEAVQVDPTYAESHYSMAKVHWRRKDWPSVIKELRETLRLFPAHERAKKRLSTLEKR